MSGSRSAVVTRSTTPASSCCLASAPVSQDSTVTPGKSALSNCSISRRTTLEPSTTMTRGVSLVMWQVSAASMIIASLLRLAERDVTRRGQPRAKPTQECTGAEHGAHTGQRQTVHVEAMLVTGCQLCQRRSQSPFDYSDQHQGQHPCKRSVPEAGIQKRPAHKPIVRAEQ